MQTTLSSSSDTTRSSSSSQTPSVVITTISSIPLTSPSSSTPSLLTTLSSTCQNAPGLDYSCTYFVSARLGFCNNPRAFVNGILFTTACQKSCNLCTSKTTTQTTYSACFDNLSYCSFWESYCYLLANQQPHPCRKTCNLC